MASDWHVEETVTLEQAQHRNEYNLDIANRRVEKFFQSTRWLIDSKRQNFDIRSAVLWLGGDLINGYIHEEYEEENGLSPPQAIMWLMQRLIGGIDYLLQDKHLECIKIPCSHGNHGRMHKKPRVATGSKNSLEWLLYSFIALHYKDEKRLEFDTSHSAHQYVDVFDFNLHFTHGDEIKFNGGIGGLAVPYLKRVHKWDRVRESDYHHIGHFHQRNDFGRALCNGSLIGWNAYAMKIGADFELPWQQFYILDKRHGKTDVCPIIVTNEEDERLAA